MELIDILNVTLIEPRLKHPKIFEKFDALTQEEAFIIHNDHDPKPLYYQLLGERGKVFIWEYLENGPELWKVKITKSSEGELPETIGQMVAKDYRKAEIFKKLGIDFCCGGKKTVDEVCKTKGLDVNQVNAELSFAVQQEQNPSLNFDKWDLNFLTDYIINTHHYYVKENVPFITELANKVAKVHGERHAEAVEVADIFTRLGKDLSLHLMKEENLVFPFIKELVHKRKQGAGTSFATFDSISTPTQMMEVEHEQAGEDMASIRTLTNNYLLPVDACTSYTILYKKLQEFENDLFNHVHLENNILFPKAIELEQAMRN
ncbi:MAG: iron-sulfur cluster repair di-iron protein [Daejeonella sp.]